MSSFEFDWKIAKREGVNEAIVLHYIQSLSQYLFVTSGSKEVTCTETLLLTKFQWLNSAHLKQILTKLEKHQHLTVQEGASTLQITPTNIDEKVKKARSITTIPVDVREITYARRTEHGLEEITVNLGQLVSEFIDQFSVLGINPHVSKFYKSKSERQSIIELFEQHGVQEMFDLLTVVVITNKQKFAPKIRSPKELFDKYSRLLSFVEQLQQERGEIML